MTLITFEIAHLLASFLITRISLRHILSKPFETKARERHEYSSMGLCGLKNHNRNERNPTKSSPKQSYVITKFRLLRNLRRRELSRREKPVKGRFANNPNRMSFADTPFVRVCL